MKKILILLVIMGLLSSCVWNNQENNELKVNSEEEKEEIILENKDDKEEVVNIKEIELVNTWKIIWEKEINYEARKENIETAKISKEDNSDLIYKYYKNIEKWNLAWAYLMKYNPTLSIEDFKKQYKLEENTYVSVKGLKEESENKYNFSVDFFDEINWAERYKTSMEIIDWKLKTISTKKIEKEITEEFKYNSYRFFIQWDKWSKTLYLEKDWKKEVIKEQKMSLWDDWKYSLSASVSSISWLNVIWNWKVLVFSEWGWEYRWKWFYNLESQKLITEWGVSNYWVTKDKKFLYTCWLSWMSSWWVNVYNLSDLTLYKDLVSSLYNDWKNTWKLWYISNCYIFDWYDKEKNTLKFQLDSGINNGLWERGYEYNFNTWIVTKK